MILLLFTLQIIIGFVSCIQNGQDVTAQNKYPFYVMIGNPHICGGTLLSYDPALILTAAHCVDAPVHPTEFTKKEKNPYFALYNDIHRDKQKASAIVDWYIHPLYNVSGNVNFKYDAAIIQLETPLRKSARIKRAPLWSPTLSPNPSKGELIGFGYKDIEGRFATTLQKVDLKITKTDLSGVDYIESKTNADHQIACHGDSGGPLILYETLIDPFTNKSANIPFVIGDLTRIFGARDENTNQPSCPVPIKSTQVTEVFTNTIALLDWISDISGISIDDLTDPFYSPPCKNCRKSVNVSEEEDEEEGSHRRPKWSIGVVADENGLLDTEDDQDNIWIGSVPQDFYVKTSSMEDASSSSTVAPLYSLFLFTFIVSIYTLLLFT